MGENINIGGMHANMWRKKKREEISVYCVYLPTIMLLIMFTTKYKICSL